MFKAITVKAQFFKADRVYVVHCPFCSHDHAHYNTGFNVAHCVRGRYFIRKEEPNGKGNGLQSNST